MALKNKFASLVLTVVSSVVLLLGLTEYVNLPEIIKNIGEIGDAFKGNFLSGLMSLLLVIIAFVAIAALVVGILGLCNVIKAEIIFEVLAYVLAGLVIAVSVIFAIESRSAMVISTLIYMLITTVAGALLIAGKKYSK